MRAIYVLLAGGLALVPPLSGDEKSDPAAQSGAATYRRHCATCHGAAGKGDGPLAHRLRVAPPDLTKLARKNGGKFPFDKVYRIVDGRDPVPGHGGGDMPVWGDIFKADAETTIVKEAVVRGKLLLIIEYLESIQQK